MNTLAILRSGELLEDQTHRELVNRPFQFQKRSQHLIGRDNETLSVAMRAYEVRPRKDHRGVDLISDVLPFGRLWYNTPDSAIGYAVDFILTFCEGDLASAS